MNDSSKPATERSPEDRQLAEELVERARSEGVDLVGPDGLLAGLEVRYMRMEGEGSAIANLDDFVETLGRFLENTSNTESDDRVQLASEVYMGAAFESSDRARFVTYITVLEILANRQRRTQPELDVIQAAVDQLDGCEDLSPSTRQSLRAGLMDLQSESIGASTRSLVESMDTSRLDLGHHPIRDSSTIATRRDRTLCTTVIPGLASTFERTRRGWLESPREALLSRLVSE